MRGSRLNASTKVVMFKTIGTLRYSPKLLGDQSHPNWWLVIDCDRELGKYYRRLYSMYHHECYTIQRPAWAEHVTVIRNEEPPNKHLWMEGDGQDVEIIVHATPESDGHYVWFPVECDFVLEIRSRLGLTRQPAIPLHLSIGHDRVS